MEKIREFVETLKIGRKQSYLNMILFPLLAAQTSEPDYLTLGEALERGVVRVTEIDESGSVPELKLLNTGGENLLLVEGEELMGAKQNRIVNATFLIPGNTEVKLPVSCVEQGRWSYRSRDFRTSGKMMHASLRRDSQKHVRASVAEGRGFRSDQGEIWDSISEKARRLRAEAPTGAMFDLYESADASLETYLRAFRLVECQVGAIFAINDRIVGLDCFGFEDTFKRFFERLIESYALDAVDWRGESKADVPVGLEHSRRFRDAIAESQAQSHPSLGLGNTLRFESGGLSGAALVHEGRVLHLSAFEKGNESGGGSIGFQRFSSRRSHRNL